MRCPPFATTFRCNKGGTMKRKKHLRIAALALGVTAAIFVSSASAHAPKTVTIRHQLRGCHTWSFANGPFTASLKIRVDRVRAAVSVNNDALPQKLLQFAGPKVTLGQP